MYGGKKMKETYTLKELAKRWNVSYLSLFHMVKDGKVKGFRVGNQWRVKAQEVQRIEDGKQ